MPMLKQVVTVLPDLGLVSVREPLEQERKVGELRKLGQHSAVVAVLDLVLGQELVRPIAERVGMKR